RPLLGGLHADEADAPDAPAAILALNKRDAGGHQLFEAPLPPAGRPPDWRPCVCRAPPACPVCPSAGPLAPLAPLAPAEVLNELPLPIAAGGMASSSLPPPASIARAAARRCSA